MYMEKSKPSQSGVGHCRSKWTAEGPLSGEGVIIPRAFAIRMLIYIVGVVVIERARVIGARQFSAMCFGAIP